MLLILKDLNLRTKTLKLLETNIKGQLHGIGYSSDFLNMTPKAQITQEK